jgi:hypothetical protein
LLGDHPATADLRLTLSRCVAYKLLA